MSTPYRRVPPQTHRSLRRSQWRYMGSRSLCTASVFCCRLRRLVVWETAMTKWRRSPAELVRRFDSALPTGPNIERRQMFGYPCGFVNGNMFAGLHEDRLVVRAPKEAERYPCVILGRTLKQYALLENANDLSDESLGDWINRGYQFAKKLARSPKKVKSKPRGSK